MDAAVAMDRRTPQEIVRGVVDLCADCELCRTHMEEECAFFPELYRLWDQQDESGIPIPEGDLRRLVGRCTLCGLCPCARIPAEVMSAKSGYIDQEGLPLATRLINDVPRLARICGSFPRLVDAVQSNTAVRSVMRKVANVHPERRLPAFSGQSFFEWAEKKGLSARKEGIRQVAYFAGCTAGYLFPQIGRSVVEVMERNGASVYVPHQVCCGMPLLAEGDREAVMQRVHSNMKPLLEAVRLGDAIVCSCPTCGYFMKVLLKGNAYFSEANQKSIRAGEDEIKLPDPRHGRKRGGSISKSGFKRLLKDDGYFSAIDPMARIALAEKFFDVGEYLALLHGEGRLDTNFKAVPGQMVFFASCHQREQHMGSPYLNILKLIPGLSVELVGTTDCCGMGGNFGFKDDFHEQSLAIGRPLLEKIRKKDPQAIISDCLSCNLQFSHSLPYPVYHPLEILARAYQSGDEG